MKELKLYISAGIFIALTAVKMLFPQISDEIRDGISEALKMESDQTQAIIALGSSLTKENIIKAFDFLRYSETQTVGVDITPMPMPTSNPTTVPTSTPTPSPTPTPTPTPTPEPTTPPKVAAFYESQKAFSEYAVPSNVSYDFSELPFKCTSPVKGVTSSGFGYRMHPIKKEVKYHYGTDFAANTGEKVYSFADGKIYAIGENDSYGKYVIIDHADGYRTLYAHCSKHLKSGGKVKRGEVIALVGESGAATGPHLHFELMLGKNYLNPEFYI